METNKQPLKVDQIINNYFPCKCYTRFKLKDQCKICAQRDILIDAFEEYAESQTKPLLEEISKLKEEKEYSNKIFAFTCIERDELTDENEKLSRVIESWKKEEIINNEWFAELQTKISDLEHSLSLSKKENEELKEVLQSSEKNYVGKNARLESELTSVKEQLADAKENEKHYHDKCFKLEDQNKELAEAYDKLMNSYSKLLKKIQGKQ